MRLVLDVENSVTNRGGKKHLDPFEIGNELVQVGVLNVDSKEEFIFNFNHVESKDITGNNKRVLQQILDNTTLLIMHNQSHDLMWLWASGFKYEGATYDTMLSEYVLLRGQKQPLSLGACAERRGLSVQKDDTLKRYFKEGYNTNEIPLKELTHYLKFDLAVTSELFLSLEQDYRLPSQESLINPRDISFRVSACITRMYMHGFQVDRSALIKVKKDFELEKTQIQQRLTKQVRFLMGDTPINLNSPEQVSHVLYSRKPINKKEWVELFNYDTNINKVIKANTVLLGKTIAFTCPACKGVGRVFKKKKDGTNFAKPSRCVECDTRGYKLKRTKEMAGLGFSPLNSSWISANGFAVGKDKLDSLISIARNKGMTDAISFITDLKRLSALSSYLSSFVEGINNFIKQDGLLHVTLTQHITSTGRFSGRNPNMQNMPRGNTFPVKKVFISRWEDGLILECDFAQLEFRVAAFLSQDATAMKEIDNGFDVHNYTAKVISDAGQPISRTAAKAHTFAPLFGASAYGKSKAEGAYYNHFNEKYQGIAAWHKQLGKEALRLLKITTPTGRQFAFPDIKANRYGKPSHFTMIKNYPVQSVATADIVPVVLLEIEKDLLPFKSCLVNTVHDSMVIDVHPEEEEDVIQTINKINEKLNDIIYQYYKIKMNVPLLLESKIGPNWLDTTDI